MSKLIPVPDELSQPFWDAVNERKLIIQNCDSCNKLQYPPKPACDLCGSDSLSWKETSGKGHVLSFFVVYDGRYQVRIPDQPYNVAVITLDDDPGINFYSNLEGTPVREVPVGAAVEVTFEEVSPGLLIHEWKLI